jgi:hypothetical protein
MKTRITFSGMMSIALLLFAGATGFMFMFYGIII